MAIPSLVVQINRSIAKAVRTMKSTPEMRARARELATPPRDDFDRAVLAILDDFDALEQAYDMAVAGRQQFRDALRRERQHLAAP